MWSSPRLCELRIRRCHKLQPKLQMWLTSGIAVAVVEACELPYAAGAALKRKQNETKKKFSGLFLFSGFFLLFVCFT